MVTDGDPRGPRLLMLARVWPRMAGDRRAGRWRSTWASTRGSRCTGYLQAQIFAQLSDAVKPFAPGWGAVNSALVLLGLLTVLAYFFFSAPTAGSMARRRASESGS